MKKVALIAFLLTAATLVLASQTHAAEIVGTEKYEVSWHGAPASDNGDAYQVFYGQVDGNREAYSVYDGLTAQSRSVWLRYLKPCTAYSWSVKTRVSGKWSWIIRDNRFTTQGACIEGKAPTTYGNSQVNEVREWSNATTSYGSSTVSWSPRANATAYYVYYGTVSGNYEHSVKVPNTGSSVTINYLTPGVTYYYRIAAEVDSKLQWYTEKTLQTASGATPVLGVSTTISDQEQVQMGIVPPPADYSGILNSGLGVTAVAADRTQVLGETDSRTTRRQCTGWGSASVVIRVPSGISVARVHVLYGTNPGKYAHALRNLEPSAREITIGSLYPCRTYYYQVVIIDLDGRAHWQGEKTMQVGQ